MDWQLVARNFTVKSTDIFALFILLSIIALFSECPGKTA